MSNKLPRLLLAALTLFWSAAPAVGAPADSIHAVVASPNHVGFEPAHRRSAIARVFACLMEMFAGTVENRCRQGGGIASDTQDIVQEVWKRAWQRFDPSLAVPTVFLGFVLIIANNVLREHWRRKARSRRIGSTDDENCAGSVAASTVGGEPTPLTNLCADETRERTRELLALLPRREREVVKLHLFEELSMAAIGSRLGISAAAATKRWQRSLHRMREDARWTPLLD
jgi:RNA polymerase sigma factor (sigma-70 family)